VPKFEVRQALASGEDVVLRIDVQGAATIRKLAPEALLIFVAPGTFDELRERLIARHTDSAEDIEQRLAVVWNEMASIEHFDYIVINGDDQLDRAVEQICAIVLAEKQRVRPRHVQL
jgi:guanylate kinase